MSGLEFAELAFIALFAWALLAPTFHCADESR